MTKKRKDLYRKIGLGLLVIPVGFISLFLVGELIGGDITGLGHLIQLIPLIILWLLARKFPHIIGMVLQILGTILFVLYNYASHFSFPIVSLLLFVPIIVSGFLIFISSRPK